VLISSWFHESCLNRNADRCSGVGCVWFLVVFRFEKLLLCCPVARPGDLGIGGGLKVKTPVFFTTTPVICTEPMRTFFEGLWRYVPRFLPPYNCACKLQNVTNGLKKNVQPNLCGGEGRTPSLRGPGPALANRRPCSNCASESTSLPFPSPPFSFSSPPFPFLPFPSPSPPRSGLLKTMQLGVWGAL